MKPVYSFRLDKELIDKARASNVDLAKIIEAALAKKLKTNKCPYCGAKGGKK